MGLLRRLDTAEERISALEDTSIESFKIEENKQKKLKRLKKTEQNIEGLWDNHKRYNVHIMEIPEERK